MKNLLAVCFVVLSMTLFSFTTFEAGGVKKLSDGNYHVEKGALSAADGMVLLDMTRKAAGETTVVHTTVWQHKDATKRAASETTIVHETIWKHKDAEAAQSRGDVVGFILGKYL